jgi:hypothetical protein
MERGKGLDKINKYVTCVEIMGRKAIHLVRSRMLQTERSEFSTQKDLATGRG